MADAGNLASLGGDASFNNDRRCDPFAKASESREQISNTDFAKVVKGIAEVSDEDEEEALDAAKLIAIKVKQLCDSAEKLRDMMSLLHENAMKSEETGEKTALLFSCLSQLKVDNVKCRNVFLRRIQEDFSKSRDTPNCNLIAFLCQIFRRVRVADGTTIAAIANPILDSLEHLLQKQPLIDQRVVLFSRQLQIIGPELRRLQPEKFANLMIKVRLCVTQSKTLLPESIAALLIALELSTSKSWTISEDLEAFYRSILPRNCRTEAMDIGGLTESMQALPTCISTPAPTTPAPLACGVMLPDTSLPPPGLGPPALHSSNHPQSPPSLFQRMPPIRPPPTTVHNAKTNWEAEDTRQTRTTGRNIGDNSDNNANSSGRWQQRGQPTTDDWNATERTDRQQQQDWENSRRHRGERFANQTIGGGGGGGGSSSGGGGGGGGGSAFDIGTWGGSEVSSNKSEDRRPANSASNDLQYENMWAQCDDPTGTSNWKSMDTITANQTEEGAGGDWGNSDPLPGDDSGDW